MKNFWEVIYDDEIRTFDLRESSNDELFTNNVAMLQNNGFNIHCQTGDIDKLSGSEKMLIGYTREIGLYQRLLLEFEEKTGKTVIRW